MYMVANQLELSGGMRRDRGEFLVDAELYMPPPAIQKKGNLYIIGEIEGVPPDLLDPGGRNRATDAELCRETQMTILQEYYNFNSTATITAALRHALEVANQQVFNRNSAMLPPERRGVGVTCAVVRGSEVYLAQIQPTQAFLTHQGQLKTLPSSQEWVRGPRPVAPVPSKKQDTLPLPANPGTRRTEPVASLGRYSNIEPNLSRHVFEDGDMLILCSTNIAHKLSNEQANTFFMNQDGRAVLYSLSDFARSLHITDGYVLTVGAKAEYATTFDNQKTDGAIPVKAEENPSRFRNSVEGVAASVSMLTSKFAGRNRDRNVPPHHEEYVYEDQEREVFQSRPKGGNHHPENEAVPLIVNDQRPSPADSGMEPLMSDDRNNDPWLRREDDNIQQPPYLRNRKAPKEPPAPPPPPNPPGPRNFTYNDGPGANPPNSNRPYNPPRTPMINEEPEDDQFHQWEVEQPAKKSFFGGKREKREREKPSARLQATPSNSPYVDLVGVDGYGPPLEHMEERGLNRFTRGFRGKRWPLIVALVILLGIAVLFLIFAVRGGPGGTNSKALDLVKSAEQKRGQAQALAASNPAQARKLIASAQDDLASASKEQADLKDISSVQAGLKITLDNINRVVVPADLRLAVDLTSQGTGVKISQGVLSEAGDTLYLLDTGKGAVYAADLVGGIKSILKTGDPAGGSVFGKPVAMTSRLDSIVVLDDQNITYIFNKAKGDWTAAKLGGTAGWTKPVRQMATYQGNLYLLGPVGGQILKYSAGNYGGQPEEWLNPAQVDSLKLDQASAFSIDGTIFTLSKEGRLLQLARPSGKPKGESQADYDLSAGDRIGPAINNPLSLQVGALEYPYAFVVDSEKRVLQFQKEGGAFVQQFQAAPTSHEFDNLRDVAIDAANNKLYVINEQKVYVFKLPATTTGPVINATVGGPVPGLSVAPVGTSGTVGTGGTASSASPAAPKPTPTFKP